MKSLQPPTFPTPPLSQNTPCSFYKRLILCVWGTSVKAHYISFEVKWFVLNDSRLLVNLPPGGCITSPLWLYLGFGGGETWGRGAATCNVTFNFRTKKNIL